MRMERMIENHNNRGNDKIKWNDNPENILMWFKMWINDAKERK